MTFFWTLAIQYRKCLHSITYISVIISQVELKFVTNSTFKEPFRNLRPKLEYSKNRIFVPSHFGTVLYMSYLHMVSFSFGSSFTLFLLIIVDSGVAKVASLGAKWLRPEEYGGKRVWS